MHLLLYLYLAMGLFFILLSLPLIGEKVKPNIIYGFRVRATLQNPTLWYAVNHHAGKRMLWSGIIFTLGALGLFFIPGIGIDAYALGCLAFFLIPFTIGIIQSFQYLKSLE